MKTSLFAIAGFGVVLLSGCSAKAKGSQAGPVVSAALEREILERTRAFSQAVIQASASGWSAKEVATLADFYSDETVVFPPRGPALRGREALRTYWTRSPDRRILEHAAIPERLDVSHALAAEHGKLRLTYQVGSAASIKDSATYVSHWRRDGDGIWRKQLDTWW